MLAAAHRDGPVDGIAACSSNIYCSSPVDFRPVDAVDDAPMRAALVFDSELEWIFFCNFRLRGRDQFDFGRQPTGEYSSDVPDAVAGCANSFSSAGFEDLGNQIGTIES